MTELYRSQNYVVRFLLCDDTPSAIVCFEYWKPSPALDGEFAAERFFASRRLNAIGILPAENDWFQHVDIDAALQAIRQATPGFTLIGYGGSMGAYAAINFADMLGLQRVIAICPQFSIDSARVPFESRWRQEAARIASGPGFMRDRIDLVVPPVKGWLVFDPGSPDAQHSTAIQTTHSLDEVYVRFGRHNEMGLLQQAEVFTPMLLDMIDGSFDVAAFRRRLRSARRQSATFWLGLSEVLGRRGQPDSALRALERARTLPHPEPAEIDTQHARIKASLGDAEEARTLAQRRAADHGYGHAANQTPSSLRPNPLASGKTHASPRRQRLWQRAVAWLRRSAKLSG